MKRNERKAASHLRPIDRHCRLIGRHRVASDWRPRCAQQAGSGCEQGNHHRENRCVTKRASRIALVVGNGHYPDASAPLTQPINDARALTAVLRRNGFDVDVVEDANKDDVSRAIGRLKSKIRPDSVVMLFFGGMAFKSPARAT